MSLIFTFIFSLSELCVWSRKVSPKYLLIDRLDWKSVPLDSMTLSHSLICFSVLCVILLVEWQLLESRDLFSLSHYQIFSCHIFVNEENE